MTTRSCGGQTITFTWSAENRLTGYSVGGAGGPTVTMDYDAGGRLSRRISSATGTTHFRWAGGNLVAELDGAGNKVAEYSYYGLDRLHEVMVGTTTYNAHQDAQGNVLALTDANRNLARTYNYEDFGRGAGGTDYAALAGRDRARWKGALWMGPEVELYYMRNRWYEPQTGRFLSEDPIGLGGGINPYAFVGGDPIGGMDPSGLDDEPHRACPDMRKEECWVWIFPPINRTAPEYEWPDFDPAESGYWPYGRGPGSPGSPGSSGSSGSSGGGGGGARGRGPRVDENPHPTSNQACLWWQALVLAVFLSVHTSGARQGLNGRGDAVGSSS